MNEQERLQSCFVNALGSGAADGVQDMNFGAAAWDSVAHIALVSELETAFGVELTPEDITQLTSYSKAQHILARHGVSFTS